MVRESPRSSGIACRPCRKRGHRAGPGRRCAARTDAQWPHTRRRGRSPRVRFHGRDGTQDAVDRGPRDPGQPVNLALAQARIDSGPDDPVAPTTGRVLPGGPAGQHLPGPADGQLRHASRATLSQHVLQQESVPGHRAASCPGLRPRQPERHRPQRRGRRLAAERASSRLVHPIGCDSRPRSASHGSPPGRRRYLPPLPMTDCDEQSVIRSLQSAHSADSARHTRGPGKMPNPAQIIP